MLFVCRVVLFARYSMSVVYCALLVARCVLLLVLLRVARWVLVVDCWCLFGLRLLLVVVPWCLRVVCVVCCVLCAKCCFLCFV